jgi:hypothetical protein
MKVGIIIQGRPNNFDKLVEAFSTSEYKVLFCGWKGDNIKTTGNIEVLLLEKPNTILPRYCNYQSEGVLGGVSYLTEKEYTHFLKLRWDMIPNKDDVNRFVNLFITKYKNDKPIFYSVSINHCSMLQDWLMFGTESDHLKYWSIINNELHGTNVAEHIFLLNFIKANNLTLTLNDLSNINLVNKYIDFSCKEIIENDIKIDMFVGNENYQVIVDIKHYGTVDKTHTTNY